VNIIVAIAPILETSFDDKTPLIPPTMLQAVNNPPIF
jgi:hypothetical protein